MSVNPISIKRILSDINKLKENPLEKEGIYWHLNEENIYNFKALIIGPKGTPYEGGFYFFDFTIPDSYPLDPPKAKYCTQYNGIRYNPNLYTNGTVCLSILNTWSGPSWTPCNTLSSILVSLLGMVFIEHPLMNEPGHENSPLNLLSDYDNIIEHESLRGALLYMLDTQPQGFDIFNPIIEKYFIEHFHDYLERTLYLKKIKDKRTYTCSTYGLNLITNYTEILKKLQSTYERLTGVKIELPIILPHFSDITVAELRDIAYEVDVGIKKKNNKGTNVYKLKGELYKDILQKIGQ